MSTFSAAVCNPSAITSSEMAAWLAPITCNRMIIVMQQCGSGSFIQPLSASNRAIVTACESDGTTLLADTEGNWDEFSFHFMSALIQHNINQDGAPVLSDTNDDGKVSILEAYNWAMIKDSRPENPMYDDNGDGVGQTSWVPSGGDGGLGFDTFL